MHIGIVAEGTSDTLALEGVIKAIRHDATFVRLHPEVSALHAQGGWKSLRSWCAEWGGRLDELRGAAVDRYIDAVVIHLDCSMADKVGAKHPCPPAHATADALEIVVLGWLGLSSCPPWLVITTPSGCTEAWVVASLTPAWSHLLEIECRPAHQTENVLVARGLLRQRNGTVKKPTQRYIPLVKGLVAEISTVRKHCTTLDRFVTRVIALQ